MFFTSIRLLRCHIPAFAASPLSVFLLACPSSLIAQVGPDDRPYPLRAITALHVTYVPPRVLATESGTDSLSLTPVIELKLRQAGLRIRPQERSADDLAGVELWLAIDIIPASGVALYAYSVRLSLVQRARLTRLPRSEHIDVTTWYDGFVGLVGGLQLRAVREEALSCVDRLINGYLAANPRR